VAVHEENRKWIGGEIRLAGLDWGGDFEKFFPTL